MSFEFEELDYCATPIGELVLRRRREPRLRGREILEVKLGDDFLMSSLFTAGEQALADLALRRSSAGPLDVVVGGLGLGYTAGTALDYPQVRSLLVVEALAPVIDWHRRGLIPLGRQRGDDPRCRFVHGDFFALAADADRGFDPNVPGRRFHAVLLDVDHSPCRFLDAAHKSFYAAPGLRRLGARLHPGGVFGLWSNDPPDADFLAVLGAAFVDASACVVRFPNPYTGADAANTVYLGVDPRNAAAAR